MTPVLSNPSFDRAMLTWLMREPIAHRGFHDRTRAIVENTASAVHAAIAAGFGIEVDLQESGDGEAMVFHDDWLDRLTEGRGDIRLQTADALQRLAMVGTCDRILRLGELCDLVSGRAPLVLEIKSRFDGKLALLNRVTTMLAAYRGPVALMSFDPYLVQAMRRIIPHLPRGIVAQRHYTARDWPGLSSLRRWEMGLMAHLPLTRPHFIAYRVDDLPSVPMRLAQSGLGLPVLAWTVRSAAQQVTACTHGAQIIFEGIDPRRTDAA